eukprot:9471878-Pyramimonas_sp.AAC.1
MERRRMGWGRRAGGRCAARARRRKGGRAREDRRTAPRRETWTGRDRTVSPCREVARARPPRPAVSQLLLCKGSVSL